MKKKLLVLLALLASAWVACASRTPAGGGQPLLILISIDGCRWDFVERAETPALDGLVARGVKAQRLVPVFPTKTFPNHYSIVTGLYPEHHGVVANSMYDPVLDRRFGLSDRQSVGDGAWYGGEPIWVTAENQGLRTAPLFWPGSEAEIQGVRPTFWLPFDTQMPNAARVDRALSWLDLPPERRPSFLTLYFENVDSAAHSHDPESAEEVHRAMRHADAAVGRLLEGLEGRGLLGGTDVIIVSDHGMAATSRERVIAIDDYVDPRLANVVDWSPVLALWPREGDIEKVHAALAGAHPHLRVYRREEIPQRFHLSGHRRVAPIIAIADEGWSISSREWVRDRPHRFDGGTHGYDNRLASMGGTFIAAGPSFRQGAIVPPFENVHLYSLMARILDLEPAKTDGNLRTVRHLLRTYEKAL